MDPDELFPFHVLQEQLHKFGKFGISIASTLLPMLTSEEDSCPDLDALAEHIQNRENDHNPFAAEKTQGVFNKLMRDVIVDVDRLGYI